MSEPASELATIAEPDYATVIAPEVGLTPESTRAVIALLDEGSTVPFIARYRKEVTKGADDEAVQRTQERLLFHREFFMRKQSILSIIDEQGKLTPELRATILACDSRAALEDLYLPYKPKRRTRATIAREKGLDPLAERMWAQADARGSVEDIASEFVDPEKEVPTAADALQGARDIVAERVVETAEWRAAIRGLTWKQGLVYSKAARGKAKETSKFTDYYDFQEPVNHIRGHRMLAILRGEKEGFLSHKILPDTDTAKALLVRRVVGERSIWSDQVKMATEDAYDRLLSAQIATDVRAELKERADREAIEVFAENLRDLLLASPFGSRPVMAIDPGFRTGCKVVVLSETGRLLDHGVVYPTVPRQDVAGTERALDAWFKAHPTLAAVAVGNGTGGRETFAVVRDYLKKRDIRSATAVMVNESGASVYSASAVAREEMPDQDVTVRGAVSIGRRLQDPLAELVKIDPKSIGVGQYQHDVDQKALKQALDDVVMSCVNKVGVDLNTASASLLQYVSGLNTRLANAVVKHRDEAGAFGGRDQLMKVSGLGAKTFEQAAGFLRVKGGNPLDDSAVHPERYALVERMARDLGQQVGQLIGDRQLLARIDMATYVDDSVGQYTLGDILEELERPGLDPRSNFEAVAYRDDVNSLDDLREGMVLSGVVTNVTHFGAFVDVGVHQDGLVHISQLADRYVENPSDVVHVGQTVQVKVLEVDKARQRVAMSMKQA